ncbi:hypothetical protein GGX14DRAFT_334383, partial [Mycena pura]
MNPILPMPETFDKERLDLNQSLNSAMPDRTSPDLIFSTPFSEDEMGDAKDHLVQHPPTSSRGYDQKSYADVCDLENDALCDLSDPNSYRTIGLESCFLKLVTLLIHMRLTKWCMAVGMLPNSQNAFREGYHTNDNMFILRCAVDRARAMGVPLYVVFADLSNAFPSTDQATLWLKMRGAGAGGPIFD